ncbi:hypothetical protein OK074_8826, partial [Actinobacteria bacterium OK074]
MAACSLTGNPVADVAVGFFQFLGDPIGTIIKGVANGILAAAIAVFGALTTAIPTLSSVNTSRQIDDQTQGIVVYLAVGSLLFAAGRMALERRGDAGRTALKGILRVVLVSGAAATVVTAAAGLSDRYADFLFAQGAQQQLDDIGCRPGDDIEATLLLILAFLLLIAGIVQTILLFVRLGVMIILLGTLPLAAAASMTDWGGGWWRKHIGWMIAWLLYKPAAGLVMFAGSAMIRAGDQGNGAGGGINERIAGIGVMLLSAIALPALLKLVVPATAALGSGNAMSTAMSTVGSLASGAKSVGGGGGSAGQAGPSGATGATGSGGAGGGSGSAGAMGSGGSSGAAGTSGAAGGAGSAGAAGAGAAGAAAAAAGPPAAAGAPPPFVGPGPPGGGAGAGGGPGP